MATSSNSAQSAASSSEIEMRDLLIDDEESKEAEINDISLDEIDTLTDDTLYSFESSAKRPTSFCSGKRAIWLIGGMFVVFVLLIIAGGETLRYVRRPHSQSTDDIEKQQQLDEWGRLAREISNSMNKSVDPCVDFYEYACGGWLQSTKIPSDKSSYYRSFTSIADANKATLQAIIEGDWPLLGPMYDSCMDTATIEARGITPLEGFLQRVESLTLENLFETTGFLHHNGIPAFFDFGVGADFKRPEYNIAELDQGGLGLPDRDYYLNTDGDTLEIQDAYKLLMETLLAQVEPASTDLHQRVAAVFRFEKGLAEVSLSRTDRRNLENLYHIYTRSGVSELLSPGMREYFAEMGLSTSIDSFNVLVPDFFAGLKQLLHDTELSVLRTYVRWCIISETASLLPESFRNPLRVFSTKFTGIMQVPPRNETCFDRVNTFFGRLVGRYFVQEAFSGDSKDIAQDLVDRIKVSFGENLPNIDWMDSETKLQAQRKLDLMRTKIGYPETWPDYEGFTVYRNSYFENVISGWRYVRDENTAKAGMPVDRTEWHMTPQTVNAYYSSTTNEMVFPAAILQPPFFKSSYPAEVNFGGIGSVMGHELTHGFDDSGRRFDGNGMLTQWWSEASIANFQTRAQCLADLYDGFTISSGKHVKGRQTLGENIADCGGVKDSFRALQSYLRDKKNTQRTEQEGSVEEIFGFTHDQLFFVSYGQAWCGLVTPQRADYLLNNDVHSPAKARVNLPLSQFDEFAKAFSCPADAPMNPQSRCSVW